MVPGLATCEVTLCGLPGVPVGMRTVELASALGLRGRGVVSSSFGRVLWVRSRGLLSAARVGSEIVPCGSAGDGLCVVVLIAALELEDVAHGLSVSGTWGGQVVAGEARLVADSVGD